MSESAIVQCILHTLRGPSGLRRSWATCAVRNAYQRPVWDTDSRLAHREISKCHESDADKYYSPVRTFVQWPERPSVGRAPASEALGENLARAQAQLLPPVQKGIETGSHNL